MAEIVLVYISLLGLFFEKCRMQYKCQPHHKRSWLIYNYCCLQTFIAIQCLNWKPIKVKLLITLVEATNKFFKEPTNLAPMGTEKTSKKVKSIRSQVEKF
jgi:hypothetical protein